MLPPRRKVRQASQRRMGHGSTRMNADRADFFESGWLVLDRCTTSCRRDRLLPRHRFGFETDLHGGFRFSFLLMHGLIPCDPSEIKNRVFRDSHDATTKSFALPETWSRRQREIRVNPCSSVSHLRCSDERATGPPSMMAARSSIVTSWRLIETRRAQRPTKRPPSRRNSNPGTSQFRWSDTPAMSQNGSLWFPCVTLCSLCFKKSVQVHQSDQSKGARKDSALCASALILCDVLVRVLVAGFDDGGQVVGGDAAREPAIRVTGCSLTEDVVHRWNQIISIDDGIVVGVTRPGRNNHE